MGAGSLQRPVSTLNKGCVNSPTDTLRIKTHTFSFPSFAPFLQVPHLEIDSHITRIDGRSGNEPKLFSPVLLYNANVFLSHIPKYANHQLQHKFSGSYTYLSKFLQTFLKKSLHAHKLLHAPGFLSSHNSTVPLLHDLLSSRGGGFYPRVECLV